MKYLWLILGLTTATTSVANNIVSDVSPVIQKYSIEPIITQSELKEIFTGKKINWNNGRSIVLVLMRDNTPTTRVFARDYLNMSPMMLFDIINSQTTHGSRNQPIILDTDKDVIKYVSKTPGAVGYASNFIIINNANLIEAVKVTTK